MNKKPSIDELFDETFQQPEIDIEKNKFEREKLWAALQDYKSKKYASALKYTISKFETHCTDAPHWIGQVLSHAFYNAAANHQTDLNDLERALNTHALKIQKQNPDVILWVAMEHQKGNIELQPTTILTLKHAAQSLSKDRPILSRLIHKALKI